MMITNPRLEAEPPTLQYGLKLYPYRLVADVDTVPVVIRLYDTRPSEEQWQADYSLWCNGFQYAGTLLFSTSIQYPSECYGAVKHEPNPVPSSPDDGRPKMFHDWRSLPILLKPVPAGTQCVVIRPSPGDPFLPGTIVTVDKPRQYPRCEDSIGRTEVMEICQLARLPLKYQIQFPPMESRPA